MADRLETAEDVRRAYGLPDAQSEAPKPAHAAAAVRSGGKALAADAFPLSRSYEVKGVVFSEIALRAPRGREYWEHGDVEDWQVIAERQPIRVLNLAAVRAYAELCASIPGEPSITGADIVAGLDLTDTIAVRRAVVGFFSRAFEAGSG